MKNNQTNIISQLILFFTVNNEIENRIKVLENKLLNADFSDFQKVFENTFLPEFLKLFQEFINKKQLNSILTQAKEHFKYLKPKNKFEQLIFDFYEVIFDYLPENINDWFAYEIKENKVLEDVLETSLKFVFYLFLAKLITEKRLNLNKETQNYIYRQLKFFTERYLAFLALFGFIKIQPEKSQFLRNVYIHKTILATEYNMTNLHKFTTIEDLLK